MKRIGLLLFTILYFSFSAFGMYKAEDVTSLFKTNDVQFGSVGYLELIKIVCENTRQTVLNVGQFMKVVKVATQENKNNDTQTPVQEKKTQSQLTLVPQYKLHEFKTPNNTAPTHTLNFLHYSALLGAVTKVHLLLILCIFMFLYRLKLHRSRARGALAIVVNFLEKINPVLSNQSGVFLLIKKTLERCSNV